MAAFPLQVCPGPSGHSSFHHVLSQWARHREGIHPGESERSHSSSHIVPTVLYISTTQLGVFARMASEITLAPDSPILFPSKLWEKQRRRRSFRLSSYPIAPNWKEKWLLTPLLTFSHLCHWLMVIVIRSLLTLLDQIHYFSKSNGFLELLLGSSLAAVGCLVFGWLLFQVPLIFPSIGVFSADTYLCIMCPKYLSL